VVPPERTIEVADGETILDAALRQGLPLVHQCRSGSCSTCAARVVSGEVEMAKSTAMSLIPAEVAEGVRLLCLAHPQTEAVIAMDYPINQLFEGGAQQFQAKVLEFERVAHNVVRLLVTVPRGLDLEFRPGQYMRIKVPGSDEWRSYSPSSAPRQLPKLEFLIRILDDGLMSNALRGGLRRGAVLDLDGPYGNFYLRDDHGAPRLFMAGGTGLAPVMSMIDTIRHVEGARSGRVTVSFGCNQERDIFFKDELELRESWMPALSLRVSAMQLETAGQGLVQGNPVSLLTPEEAGPTTVAYLCGPPAMIEAARERLVALGVQPDHIHYEQFTPSA